MLHYAEQNLIPSIDTYIEDRTIDAVFMFSNQYSVRTVTNYAIRRLAVDYGVPLVTTPIGARGLLASRTPGAVTIAKTSAEYSPSEKPAVCVTFCRAEGSSWCSLATEAMDVRNTQTCEKRVSFKSASGPFWINSSRSLPKTSDASENISRTPATSS